MDEQKKSPEKENNLSSESDNDDLYDVKDSKKSLKYKVSKTDKGSKENRPASLFIDNKTSESIETGKKPKSIFEGIISKDSDIESINYQNKKNESLEKNSEHEFEVGLTEAESSAVAKALIDARNEELYSELQAVEDDSPGELEVLADVALLESLREKLEDGRDFTHVVIDESFQETVEDLGIIDRHDVRLDSIDNEKTEEYQEGSIDVDNENDIEDDFSNSRNNLPNYPENPLSPPSPPGDVTTFSSGPYKSPRPNINFTSQNNSYITANQTNTVIEYVERRRRGRDLLVGAIVGYVIGRRGGRKRTEKKLLPKLDKLEKEVSELHDIVTAKEQEIRKLARAAADSDFKIKSREEKHARENHRIAYELVQNRQMRNEIKLSLKRREELQEKESFEKLTKFTLPALNVFQEKRIIDGNENSQKRKDFEIMTDNELLQKATNIRVQGVSVVEMYYAGRLSRNSVLEIVKKYYRKGQGSYEQVFWKELKNDPEHVVRTREQLEKLHKTKSSNAKKENLNENYTNNESTDIDNQNFYQRHANSEEQNAEKKAQEQRKNVSFLPIVTITIVLAVLFVGFILLTG